uniref:HTH LytTR-type domain-containing protein n=1 Tax=Acrobeloides nanus TaxID=290746 RepID=A0A914CAL4_9BILA
MFLNEREELYVSKAYSKALDRLIERKYRKEPDLSWKIDIFNRALEARLATDIIDEEEPLDIDDMREGMNWDSDEDIIIESDLEDEAVEWLGGDEE